MHNIIYAVANIHGVLANAKFGNSPNEFHIDTTPSSPAISSILNYTDINARAIQGGIKRVGQWIDSMNTVY